MFQEKGKRGKIRHANERDDLYYLENQSGRIKVEESLSTSFLSEYVVSNKNKIWLYHRSLVFQCS